MSRYEYTTCDGCEKRINGTAWFTVEVLALGTFSDPENTFKHLCSVLCLVRWASHLHHHE